MGTVPAVTRPCCHVEQLPRPKATIAAAPAVGLRARLQRGYKYAENYDEIGPSRNRVYALSTTPDDSKTSPSVFDVRRKNTQLLYVCRHIPKADVPWHDLDSLAHHLCTLCGIEHPHICKVVECYDMPKEYLVVSEYAHGPPLLDFMRPKDGPGPSSDTAKQAPEVVRQILTALAYCHSRGIVHGRLEPSALLMAASDGGGRKFREKHKDTGEESDKRGSPQVKIRDMGLGFLLRPSLGQDARTLPPNKRCGGTTGRRKSTDRIEQIAEKVLSKSRSFELVKSRSLDLAKSRSFGPAGSKTLDQVEHDEEEEHHHWTETKWNLAAACASPETLSAASYHGNTVWEPEAESIRQSIPSHTDIQKEDDIVNLQKGAAPTLAYPNDIWAVGVIAYRLIAGHLPFIKTIKGSTLDGEDLLVAISEHHLHFHEDIWKDHDAHDVVRQMLKLNAGLRPTAAELLKHPWLKLPREPVSASTLRTLYKNAVMNMQESHFKKLVNRLVVELLPAHHPHIEEAFEAFRSLDRDRDCLLSFEEFKDGLKAFGGAKAILEDGYWDAQMLFDAADRNGTGALTPPEFYAATLPAKVSRHDKWLWLAFAAFDREDKGDLTIDEVLTTMRLLDGALCSDEQLNELSAVLQSELNALRITPDDAQALEYRIKSDQEVREEYEAERTEIETALQARTEAIDMGQDEKTLAPVPQGQGLWSRRLDNLWLFCRSHFPPYRLLHYGEFVYLCGAAAKDRHFPGFVKRVFRKEGSRCAELYFNFDLYPDRRQAGDDESKKWPPKIGSGAQAPRSIYWRKDGLTTVKRRGHHHHQSHQRERKQDAHDKGDGGGG